jgi:outer membrane receptor protein involved in Fe transport
VRRRGASRSALVREAAGTAALAVAGMAALAVAWPAAARAQASSGGGDSSSGDALEYLRLEDLMDIQVRAPSKQTLTVRDAPTVGTAVTREQIETYGWISANDILFRQPGFAPSQDFERLTVSSRGLHEGWNNNHLLVLIDGVPHNNNVNLSAYTSEITPLYIVQTMEVTRGAGSALYGSTAMNGIVALNTVSASNERPAEAMLRFGNAGTRTYDLMAGHVFKPFSFIVAYDHFETDGNVYGSYDASGRTDVTGALVKFSVNDRHASDYVWAKIEGRGALRGLSLQLHYQYWTFDTGHGWLFDIPDQPEQMGTNVESLSLTYRPRSFLHERLQTEWVLMWQRQEVDYHARLFPSGIAGFPNGLTEILDNETNVLFARGQATYRVWRDMSLLLGIENRTFFYGGDHDHRANADLSGAMPVAYPDNLLRPQGPALAPVVNHPVEDVGVYAQVATGRVLRRLVSATAGLRYDYETFNFVDTTEPGLTTIDTRTFQQVSPRVAVLFYPWHELVLKAMFDRAFRTPAPSELFGANTLFIASHVELTKPELLTTVTLAGDLPLINHLDVRADWFWRLDDNPIDFSASAPNLATNLYTLTVTGVESELLFDAPVSPLDNISGFLNYTYTHQLSEQVLDLTIQKSNELAWYPEHVFNIGAAFNGHGFSLSAQGHYQGTVLRRPSDSLNPDGSVSPFAAYRPANVAAWFQLDARVSYRVTDWLRLGVQATNLTNTHGFYLKTGRFPFDYQIQGVRVLGTLELFLKLHPH